MWSNLIRQFLKTRKFLKEKPEHDPSKACFYVGLTGLSPDERFQNHKDGYKANRYVKKYGKYLRRRLYEKFNPMTYDET